VGGAQAIAAMAYGTDSIPKCDKLFGPGNSWVAAAKSLVAADPAGAAADLPAGVTEVLVIADENASAEFVAADLLAQAEHGPDAQALLVTTSAALAGQVERAVRRQVRALSRQRILESSVAEIRLLIVDSLDAALAIANLGSWSPESMGD
jgi:histidinol dehydrogenase